VKEPNMRSRIMFPSALATGENFAPIQVRILGPDFLKCAELAQAAANEARQIPGLLDIDTGVRLNSPEWQIKVDRKRAADLGVRVSDVANAIRLMASGEDQISTYKEGAEQYDVTIQLLPEQKNDPAILSRVVIPSSRLGLVRLDNIATVERGLGPARIERFNRQFQITLYSNHAPDFPLEGASQAVVGAVKKVGLPTGYGYRSSGNVKMLDETATNLIIAFLLASIFMYMVLAAQFESFLHPFTIMLSLPLSIPFALLTLWGTGRTLNLWSALGILLLLGIVKKNGILQVDYTNKLREQGYGLREAIVEANHVRLRPILMTTVAIVAGLIPTALGLGAGSNQRSAIAVTIIGGQTLCLLLTLMVTPVAYSIFAELGERQTFAHANLMLSRWKLGLSRLFNFLQ
jgi:HAE1 family hydrophobic/amphiphilic exporter-1